MKKAMFVILGMLLNIFGAKAQEPVDYYAAAAGKAGSELRAALHAIIRGHHVIPYSSSSFDTSDALKVLDSDPANTNNVILIYSGLTASASTFGDSGWNREHLWPQSYGLDGVEPSYSDLFNLRACDGNVNSSRGNKFFDWSDVNSPNYRFPAHTEAPLCSTDTDSWQPPASQRGDIARSMFYLVTRYTGDIAGEPALALTDNAALITSANAYMGKLSVLLEWHFADPVDAAEQLRNDRIYSLYQHNRNPFVDHPEWVNLAITPAHTNPPILKIASGLPGIEFTWLATNQTTRLEYTTNFSGGWQDVPVIPLLTNGQFLARWTNDLPYAFFRLRTAQ